MELTFEALIAATFFSSIVISILKLRPKAHAKTTNNKKNAAQDNMIDRKTISSGHAYAVDAGDSFVIVIVVDKNNIGSGFLNVSPSFTEIEGEKFIG